MNNTIFSNEIEKFYNSTEQKNSALLPLPIGISDYRLASTEYYYIDKTMMIKDFIDERPMVSLFTRPRRFGKTLNMDMLRTFFEKTEEDTSIYFENKKIWTCGQKYRDYQGKYPVIFITFKDIKFNTWEETFITYVDTSVIYPQIKNNPSTIYSFLLVAGYLKVLKTTLSFQGDFMCEVALPNREILLVYHKEILQKLNHIIPQPIAISIQQAIFLGDNQKLKVLIQTLLTQSVSSFDTAGENFYHGFMLGLCTLLDGSFLTSNRESGNGRYDIQLKPIPKGLPGILIELKAEKNCTKEQLKKLSEIALQQIIDKKYDTEMTTEGIETIYKYGVAFSGKNVEISVG